MTNVNCIDVGDTPLYPTSMFEPVTILMLLIVLAVVGALTNDPN